ncbi:hypothetical protein EP331_01255 [bacterium]|nr:MAG: hypothetical protein EP331_01255 [bacterium]
MAKVPQLNGVHLVTTKSQFRDFVLFPYSHYKNDEHWVAPLLMDEKKLVDVKHNPFYENADAAFFIAEKNGEIAGRIGVIDNHAYNSFKNENVGFFGFFECVDDQTVANLLLKVAADWLKEKGRTKMMGPFNPSNMDTIGFLVDGFDKDPFVMMPYTKSYYPKLLENAGYAKEMDMYAYIVSKDVVNFEHIERGETIVRKRYPNLSIRKVNLKKMDQEVEIIKDIFNKAWANNWSFYPIADKIFTKLGKDLKMVIDTDFAFVAEVDGVPIAFSIALPNFNQILKKINGRLLPFGLFKLLYYKRTINQMRVALMGVIPEFQGKGIDSLMHKQAIVNGIEKGYQSAELSWVLETNVSMIRVAERIGAVIDKTYRIYGKELS